MKVTAIAFSPDGKYVVTGSADKTARLWDAATGASIRTFTGHSDEIDSVMFSPDGKYIVTGSADKTARLRDTATGQEVRRLSGHTDRIWSVAFSPDGKTIFTASEDKDIRLWDTDYHDFLSVACQRIHIDFTSAQRRQFAIQDAQPTCSAGSN